MKTKIIFPSLLLLSLVSCGGDGGSGSSSQMREELEPVTDGTYYTVLRPVNFHSNGFIPYGSATFKVNGDQFEVTTMMDDDQRVTHRQSVHFGTRCPTMSDDSNGDGFVDYNEALAVVDKTFLPLDNDLSSQVSGAESYPKGSSFTYSRRTSLNRVSSDLWQADENPSDEIAKLPSGESFGLNGRVILVHGTYNKNLPASVAARAGEAADVSLPVTCGVIRKVN